MPRPSATAAVSGDAISVLVAVADRVVTAAR